MNCNTIYRKRREDKEIMRKGIEKRMKNI